MRRWAVVCHVMLCHVELGHAVSEAQVRGCDKQVLNSGYLLRVLRNKLRYVCTRMWVIYCVCISLSKHMCSCGLCIYECIFKRTCGVCVMSPWGDTKIHCAPTLKQANSERENKCDKTEMERREGEEGRGISKSSRCKNSLEGEKETSKKNNIKKKKRNWLGN